MHPGNRCFARLILTWLAAVVIAALVLAGSPPASISAGTVYYVNGSTGNDANSGTSESAPWRTIQKAADTLRAGDTVYIKGGTYYEAVRFNQHSGTQGNPITFRNLPGESVVLISSTWFGLRVSVDWIVIDGLKVFDSDSHGIYVTGANHIVVQNCEFARHGWAGVMFGSDDGPTNNNIIRYNNVHDNQNEGIYLRNRYNGAYGVPVDNNVIEYNTIYNNGGEGIQNTDTFEELSPNGTVFRGNIVYGNGSWGAGACLTGNDLIFEDNIIYSNGGEVGGVWYTKGTGSVFRNNIIYSNRGARSDVRAGIHLYAPVSNTEVYHNTIVDNTGAGILLTNPGSGIVVRNNILSGNSTQIAMSGSGPTIDRNMIDGTTSVTGSNAILGRPRFADANNRNYRILAGCSSIDAGAVVPVTCDIEGVSRPQGAGFDLGAYEYVDQSNPPTATPTPSAEPTASATTEPTPQPTQTATATPSPSVEPTATTTQPSPEPDPTPKATRVPPPRGRRIVVDDADPGFRTRPTLGAWDRYVDTDGQHYGDSHYFLRNVGSGESVATWSFTVPEPGEYEVYAWWWEAANRPADVPYTIAHAGGSSTVRVDQRTDGGQWNLLGTYTFDGDGAVTVTDDVSTAGTDIVADAISLVPLAEPRPRVLVPLVMGGMLR